MPLPRLRGACAVGIEQDPVAVATVEARTAGEAGHRAGLVTDLDEIFGGDRVVVRDASHHERPA